MYEDNGKVLHIKHYIKRKDCKMKRIVVMLSIIFFLLSLNSMVLAENEQAAPPPEPSTTAKIADAVALRPAGFIGTILGTLAFVISLPVTLSTNRYKETGEMLVLKPAYFTFNRPLGQM